MRVPTSAQEFIESIRSSDLVVRSRLKEFVSAERGTSAPSLDRIAGRARATGLLSEFQLERILAGRIASLRLGAYRLISRLGSGATGDIFVGRHRESDRLFAIKVLNSDSARDPVARARLEREAAAVAKLQHPNIVGVHGFGTDPDSDTLYVALEYIDGVDLQCAVAKTGTFSAELVAECGRQIAAGLERAWEFRLVHRDIKPANLILARCGLFKILDLGHVTCPETTGLTSCGTRGRAILGTLDYLAPEQALDSSAVDCRADIYSLGATLYFLLAGHPPYAEWRLEDRLREKQCRAPVPIQRLRPDLPPGLAGEIEKMLACRPADRPATPARVASALQRFTAVTPRLIREFFSAIDTGRPRPPVPTDPTPPGADSLLPPRILVLTESQRTSIRAAHRTRTDMQSTADLHALPTRSGPHQNRGSKRSVPYRLWLVALFGSLLACVALGLLVRWLALAP